MGAHLLDTGQLLAGPATQLGWVDAHTGAPQIPPAVHSIG